MKRKSILVTGGAGYVGSHTCKALANSGFTPVTYDNLVTGNPWAVKWGPMETGDIADRERLVSILKHYDISAVLHFAAHAYVGESMADPCKYYRNNVAGSLSLLEAMEESGIKNIVFSSSCAVYGIPDALPILEFHPRAPINPYGLSKLMVEQMLESFQTAYDFRYVTLRYFNAAGADPEKEIGEAHDPEPHLIPLALRALMEGNSPLSIFGTDYPTVDGTCIRDYIHVTDLAEAHVKALAYLLDGSPPLALNLGTGEGCSVLDILRSIEKVGGKPIKTRKKDRRAGDPPMLVADSTLAREHLGWTPRYTDIDTIVRTAWDWHTK